MIARLFYSLFFYCLTPLILIRVFWRSIKEPKYKSDLSQRFGFVEANENKPIWVHAVSAGETIAAVSLVNRLLDGGHAVVMTAMTPTGRERAMSLLGGKVQQCYVPYDLPGSIKRFLNFVRPKALIIIDTELWPNMLHYTALQNIPIYLVNARMSNKSAMGYQRISMLTSPMMKSLEHVYAQTDIQGKRFLSLGLRHAQLSVSGSIKFDANLPLDFPERLAELKTLFRGKTCFLAASTHKGEEDRLIEAFKNLEPSSTQVLIIAPRHTHRTTEVLSLCQSSGLSVRKHSDNQEVQSTIYLVDTMGELIYFFGIARMAFIGGSLVDIGGHNPMEAGSLGVPMMMGSYTRNIEDIAELFIEAGAMIRISDQEGLDAAVSNLMKDEVLHSSMSEAAKKVMNKNKGALDLIENEILEQLS